MAEQNAAGWATPYRFTGKELDQQTDYYYFGARYYDPRLSYFLGVDPLAEKYPGWNPYHYVHNNPIRMVDPTGMGAEDWYLPEGGNELVYDENIKSQADLDKAGIVGTYIGVKGARVDDNGNTVSYNSDGTITDAVPMDDITISPNNSSGLASIMFSAASGAFTTAGELKHSGRFGVGIWQGMNGEFYSQAAAAGKSRPFYVNQYTGSINEAKAIAKPLKMLGVAAGAVNYGFIFNDYRQGNISTARMFTESIVNTGTTFGGIYGTAFGIGWEAGRIFTKSDWYQDNVLKRRGGKDGLLSTPK